MLAGDFDPRPFDMREPVELNPRSLSQMYVGKQPGAKRAASIGSNQNTGTGVV